MASTIHGSQPVELFAYDLNTYNIDWFTTSPGGLQKKGCTKLAGSHLGPPGPDPGQEAPNGLHRVSWDPSGALWARSAPGEPKVPPQSLLGPIWRPLGPIRARWLQSGSTEPSGITWGSLSLIRAKGPQSSSSESPGNHPCPLGPNRPGTLKRCIDALHFIAGHTQAT